MTFLTCYLYVSIHSITWHWIVQRMGKEVNMMEEVHPTDTGSPSVAQRHRLPEEQPRIH